MKEALDIREGIVISNPKCPPEDEYCWYLLYCRCTVAGQDVYFENSGDDYGPLCKRIKLSDLEPDLKVTVINNGKSLKLGK